MYSSADESIIIPVEEIDFDTSGQTPDIPLYVCQIARGQTTTVSDGIRRVESETAVILFASGGERSPARGANAANMGAWRR
jgi:hypothetical protein